MALPPNIFKRGLSLAEAAQYRGLSDRTEYGPRAPRSASATIYDVRALDHRPNSRVSLSIGVGRNSIADLPSSTCSTRVYSKGPHGKRNG
jgi:hypothetical protein